MKATWRLSESEKHLIARRYEDGDKVVVIAEIFGVAPWIVSYHARMRGVPSRLKYRKRRSTPWMNSSTR